MVGRTHGFNATSMRASVRKLKTPIRSRNSPEVMSEGNGCIRLSGRREERVLITEEDVSTQIPW
jgi:hypothetical protein